MDASVAKLQQAPMLMTWDLELMTWDLAQESFLS
jgi:hypothetical protein